MYVHIAISISIYILHTHTHTHIDIAAYSFICIHTYMFIRICIPFFYVSTHIGDICVCVYICICSHLYMYSCACSLSSNQIDLYTVMTCEYWHAGRLDSLDVGEPWREIGDSAGACWARRVGRGRRQGTHTRACPRIHVLFQECVWDYEDDHHRWVCLCM